MNELQEAVKYFGRGGPRLASVEMRYPSKDYIDFEYASVLYDTHGGYHVIECDKVIGQLVVIKHEKGTFDIESETLSTVELMNLLSFKLIGILDFD